MDIMAGGVGFGELEILQTMLCRYILGKMEMLRE